MGALPPCSPIVLALCRAPACRIGFATAPSHYNNKGVWGALPPCYPSSLTLNSPFCPAHIKRAGGRLPVFALCEGERGDAQLLRAVRSKKRRLAGCRLPDGRQRYLQRLVVQPPEGLVE